MNMMMEAADNKPFICNPDATDLADVVPILKVVGLGESSRFSLGWIVFAFFTLSLSFHTVAAFALLTHYFELWRDNRLFHAYKYGLYWNIAFWRC